MRLWGYGWIVFVLLHVSLTLAHLLTLSYRPVSRLR